MDLVTPALPGLGVVGMLGGLFWMLATGKIVTRREADAIEKRALAAEAARDAVIAQNSELMEMARLGQSVFTALRQGADSP